MSALLVRRPIAGVENAPNLYWRYHRRRRSPVDSDDLKQLESRIDQLIEACQRLRSENDSLKSEHGSLQAERAKLLEKTRIARERIESMIDRLKALERA